ncbi:MAG: M28 family peptidase [Acidobacteriia bacterium]|nr:M28 family peptidase [Terriglobia bacterium]
MHSRKNTRLVRLALAVTLLGGSLFAQTPVAQTPVVQKDAQRYLDDVKALTAPEMEGRGDATKGIARAAHLIEQRYKSLGLEPAGTQGYRQPFTVITGAKLKGDNHLRVQTAEGKSDLKLSMDFVPISFSSSGKASGALVFAGYGASATEFSYDDYAGIDVKDKIVLVLSGEPPSFSTKAGNVTHHSQLVTKAINARNHGAKALVMIHGKLLPKEEDILQRFGSEPGPTDAGILLQQAKNDAADKWFVKAGKTLAAVQEQINGATKPASFAFPDDLRVTASVSIEHTHATVNNVIAYLPGTTDEYVILGAHYDHLGYGGEHSLAPALTGQVHPGADDNASGTAGVLELARHFAPVKGKLRRGILFMSFAGEELGLLGSEAWVKEPTKPLDKAVAMLNMDMIGRIKDDKVYIGGVGTGSTFKSALEKEDKKVPLKIEYSPGGPASSDHTSFLVKKIPSLFFFSGLHADYHKPSDTWEKINAASAIKLLELVAGVAQDLDAAADRPAFQAVVEEKPLGGVSSGGGYGPYFGSIPDFGQVETGVKFSDVRAGSPAAKAGLKGGDIMIQFGDKPIKNLYDFTDALRRSKIGDVVDVTVLRDGKPLKVTVTLEQRR